MQKQKLSVALINNISQEKKLIRTRYTTSDVKRKCGLVHFLDEVISVYIRSQLTK